MNSQEIIQKVFDGLKAQGVKGYDEQAGGCIFYTENNPSITCAVGQLLNLDQRIEFEDQGIGSIRDTYETDRLTYELVVEPLGFPRQLLIDLQDAHDNYPNETIDQVLDAIREVATKYGVSIDE